MQGRWALWLARYPHKRPGTRHAHSRRLTCSPAVAFSYFETLLWLGDKSKPLQEEIRLRSLATILNDVGHQEYLYEDFADATFELLRSVSAQIPVVDDGAALLATFNDEHLSMSIITYLKVCEPGPRPS